MRRNFFIFLTKEENLKVCMKHLLYGADVSQSDQRSLANVKAGDLALIWVPGTKLLYGIFEILGRVFYDETEIGWDKTWPYRCCLRLWDKWLRVVRDEAKARLMSFVSKELTTLTDLTNLGGFIHTLLYDEGSKLFRFFISNSNLVEPNKAFPDFGTRSITTVPAPVDFSTRLSSSGMPEYVLESYLLQDLNKLEELVGSGVTEMYNMLFGYQSRYLDIMTVHRDDNGDMIKATIVELKAKPLDSTGFERALDELTSYMFWTTDQIEKRRLLGDKESVFGVLLSPFEKSGGLASSFDARAEEYARQYGIDSSRIRWVGYEYTGKDLSLRIIH